MAGVTFLPIQQGTGDPSPTNVRPINPGLTITGIGDIYGGYLDVAHGTVVETWGKVVLATGLSWNSTYASSGIYRFTASYDRANMDGLLCDKLNSVGSSYTATQVTSNLPDLSICGRTATPKDYYVKDARYTTKDDFLEVYTGTVIVYELATPITHSLTSAQLAEAMRKLGVQPSSMLARRRRLVMAQPHLASATAANPVAFSATLAAPLKGLECAFSPVQAAGTPAPDNVLPISGWTNCNVVRCGKNLANDVGIVEGKYITSEGVVSDNVSYKYQPAYIRVLPSTTYSVSINKSVETALYFTASLYDINQQFIQRENVITSSGSGEKTGTFTTTAATAFVRYTAPKQSSDIMLTIGSTATSYTPYTGQTLAVQFPATKNLLNTNGTIGHNNYNFCGFPNTLRPNTTYTFSISGATTYAYGLFLATSDTVATSTTSKLANYITSGNALTFTTPAAMEEQWLIIAGGASGAGNVSLSDVLPQVELGSTATPYEPYGTIYGGYIDPVRGVARVEWLKVPITKCNLNGEWDAELGKGAYWYTTLVDIGLTGKGKKALSGVGLCETLKPVTNISTNTVANEIAIFDNSIIRWVDLNHMTDTQSAYRTYLRSNPIWIAYQLATPIEYPLTPAVLKTLKGANVIYTDLNGNVSPIYWTN